MEKIENSPDFTEDQFKNQNKDVVWLCRTLKNEGYESSEVSAQENTIEWLNELLCKTEFCDNIVAQKQKLVLSEEIRRLRDETKENRKESFKDVNDADRQAIKRLNRLILETAYPREVPKSAYELTAIIRSRTGNSFLQDYANVQDFKRDMKEHRDDIEWGFLVRSDEGKIIDKYFSKLGDRARIGVVETEFVSLHETPWGLNPAQASLREAAINHFRTQKAKMYITEQMKSVNASRQIGEAIIGLMDEHGKPPANMPVNDIIADREKIEINLKWLEAICLEHRNLLTTLKEIEEGTLEELENSAVW